MSFRTRILVVFGVLGLLPLVVTGALGYVVSARLVEAVAGARARADVERNARILARESHPGSAVDWSDVDVATRPEEDGALMRFFLVDREGHRIAAVGDGHAPTKADTALAYRAARLVPEAPSGDGIVTLGDERWAVAHVSLPDDRWVVVGVGSLKQLTGLWGRARVDYALFVLVVLICTGLALTYLIQPIVRSLDDLTEATNLIGDGELTPWLPARSEGEVGRLSLATGAMVDRVERMMRGVEQSARMAMVGQLATHLAHEIRNPLSSIRLNLQSITRELEDGRIPSDVGEVTEICLHEIERLDRVATSVLKVGRARERRPTPGHLHEPLRRAASILGGEMSRRHISLYLDMLADCDDVYADRESLQGVFINLLMNAAESIGEDGTIRIATRTRDDEVGEKWIRIEVEDTGPGVPDHVRQRIFEPFYTTKQNGTGVGLATAMEIVTAHGGTLSLDEPGDGSIGARFTIDLPLHVSDIPAPPPRTTYVDAYSSHRG